MAVCIVSAVIDELVCIVGNFETVVATVDVTAFVSEVLAIRTWEGDS